MKTLVFLTCILGLLSWSRPAYAGFDGNPEVPILIRNADVVCVVKVVAITNVVTTQFEAVHKGRNGLPVFIDAQSAVAEAVVQNVLAGKIIRKSIQIAFFKNVRRGFNPAPFTELAAGETDIVFLKATTDDTHFALSQPTSHGKSNITIGNTKIRTLSPPTSPLRAVLLVLVDAIGGGDEAVRLECLNRISSVGFLLHVKSGVYTDEYGLKTRLALGEPVLTPESVSTSLEQFVKDHILPEVLNLAQDKNSDTSKAATIAAGKLQDPAVIITLARIAVKDYVPGELGFAAETISEYRNPDAVIPLIRILKSSSADVRQEASYSLGHLHNPLAIPFLLERLDDTKPNVVSAAGEALFEITGQFGSQIPLGDAQSLQAREVAFWKKWAAGHQDKIKELRAHFNAAAPTKS